MSDDTHAAPGEPAEVAAGVPEKRLWSKPEIWTSDGVLWTESGPNVNSLPSEFGNYHWPFS